LEYLVKRIERRLVVCALALLVTSGCAARVVAPTASAGQLPSPARVAAAPEDSLEAFMQKVRTLASEARAARTPLTTIEASDSRLAAALAASIVRPSPAAYRAVAEEYQRVGIGDRAFAYLGKALALDGKDWRTHDALARLWRDQGFANLALGDAYRAINYGAGEAAAHNTLGTIFQALGRRSDAAKSYERVLALDPAAAYALNNLCYTRFLMGAATAAIDACERALALEPGLLAASNNLALAHAARGEFAAAEAILRAGGSEAAGHYNVGIVDLARGRYTNAVSAFAAAQVARPHNRLAAARLRQSEAALKGMTE
jgi:Flp pilus assembly protein TadD